MNEQRRSSGLWRNGISLLGIIMGVCVLLAGLALLVIDASGRSSSPYLGVVLYLLLPAFLIGCAMLVALGMLLARRRMKRLGCTPRLPVIDLGDRHTLWRLALVVAIGAVLVVVGAVAAYRTYHFTESVEFCGRVCHEVMKPELTAFKLSPHANSSCTECHIGPGAKWFVKAKLSGLYQVYSVLFDKYHRPIETPVHNLRPAKETCHTCHWPEKFFGAVLRTWTYYLPEKSNPPWTIKMLLNTGGGDPAHGPVHGIHWHMEGVNDVDYIAADEDRLVIPWVRVTDQNGKETIYQTSEADKRLTSEQLQSIPSRRMDCLDCHNRPTHQYKSPNHALDMALLAGDLDASMPEIKYRAGKVLAAIYETEAEAIETIDKTLRAKYETHPSLDRAIATVQTIYRNNFFPEMKVRWTEYPDHIGHKITPGCFRCHDGKHVSDSGERIRNDCNICHTILAQGPGTELSTLNAAGLEFEHPEDIGDEWKSERCDSCHTGSP